MTEDEFVAFVTDGRWRFAKTMANIPHAYTLRKWNDDSAFNAACDFIKANGYEQRFFSKTYTYFDVGPHQYWTMGWPTEETTLINRAVRPGEETDQPLDTENKTGTDGIPSFGGSE